MFKFLRNSISILLFYFFIKSSHSIQCYECTSSQGTECIYAATSCQYGLFGCVKIAVLSGGVDKMGMFYDQEKSIISMIRGCAVLPFGGVDMCEQTSLFGTRVLKCTCFNDYCNSSNRSLFTISLIVIFPLLIFFL